VGVRADQHLSRTVIRFQTLAVRIADSERMSFARPQGGRNADDSVLGNPTPQGADRAQGLQTASVVGAVTKSPPGLRQEPS
jgi:hypothetical protein